MRRNNTITKINTEYLSTVPEAENKYNIPLSTGERVLFAAKTDAFCSETQETLKWGCKFTLTDRRIVVDGGDKIWTVNIPDDIARFRIVEEGHGLMKILYTVIDLNKKPESPGGRIKTMGYIVYLKKRDMLKLEAITDKLFIQDKNFE